MNHKISVIGAKTLDILIYQKNDIDLIFRSNQNSLVT